MLHPVLPLALAALLVPFLPPAGRRVAGAAAAALATVLVTLLRDGTGLRVELLGLSLVFLRVDALARVFAFAFALFALVASVYSWRDDGRGPRAAAMALAAGGIGVALAGNLLALYLFWEVLTLASLFLVWQGPSRESAAAGMRYLLLHVAGAMCLLAGIVLHLSHGGNGEGALALHAPGAPLVLVGFCLNAAAPPLHAWLPDAYPRASVFGTVWLSAFTTKSAVYALARYFPGTEILVWVGAGMALYGVFFAVLENDVRRLLCYHIVSQVGYMVAGVGLGTSLSLDGSAAHAFSHVFYKGLLLMSAGALAFATGTGKLSDLGDLARPLWAVLLFMAVGALSISGMPLFNGFTSKSMVISAATEAGRGPLELLLQVAAMGTFLSIGLKLVGFAFFGRNRGARVQQAVPRSMVVAMAAASALCVATGVVPSLLYAHLPFAAEYHPFTADHVVGTLQLLGGTALGFLVVRGLLAPASTRTRDVDGLYRPVLRFVVDGVGRALDWRGKRTVDAERGAIRSLQSAVQGWKRILTGMPIAVQVATTLLAVAVVGWLLVSAH